MESYQFKKLRTLLIESYNAILYYQELFSSLGFNPVNKFKRLSDLSKLPILNIEFVKKNKDLFISKNYIKNLILFKTSRSTGVPFKILVHPD